MTDLATDFDLAVMVDNDTPAPEIDARAEIEALDLADMHLQEVARLRQDLAKQKQVLQRGLERAEAILDRIERRIEWHLAPVRQLHERLHEIDPKRLTIELLHGDLKMRVPKKPQVFIDDDTAIVAWAAGSAPELLPPPEKVKVTELRKVVHTVTDPVDPRVFTVVHTATGEIVPHVHAEIPAPTWNADTEVGDI